MPGSAHRDSHFRRWGAAYILFFLFLGSWLGQYVAQVMVDGESLATFFAATFENWQSEWLQLFLQAVMLLGMKHVLFKADAEDMEQVQRKLDALLRNAGEDPSVYNGG